MESKSNNLMNGCLEVIRKFDRQRSRGLVSTDELVWNSLLTIARCPIDKLEELAGQIDGEIKQALLQRLQRMTGRDWYNHTQALSLPGSTEAEIEQEAVTRKKFMERFAAILEQQLKRSPSSEA